MELTSRAIEERLKSVNQDIRVCRENIKNLTIQARGTSANLNKQTKDLGRAKRFCELLQRAKKVLAILKEPKYEQARVLRNQFLDLITESQKDTISIRRQSELRIQTEKLKRKMQVDCPRHPFVIAEKCNPWDPDSYLPDPPPRARQCVLCGLLDKSLYGYEEGPNNRGNGFTKLLRSNCFIVDDFWTKDIWRPIQEVLNESIKELFQNLA